MSIQTPRYKPSEAYCIAALDRSAGILNEIQLSLTTVNPIEIYEDWYHEKLQNEYGKIKKIQRYIHSSNVHIFDKIKSLKECVLQTSDFLHDQLAESLNRRVEDYTLDLRQRRDDELVFSRSEISYSLTVFKDQIEDWKDDMLSPKAQQILKDAICIIDNAFMLMKIRISLYERKHKEVSTPRTSRSDLSCPELMCVSQAPKYQPSLGYFLIKAAYRNARIQELGVCMNQQKEVGRYAAWFQKKVKYESDRVDAVERYALRYQMAILDQIAECRTSLTRVQKQFQEKSFFAQFLKQV